MAADGTTKGGAEPSVPSRPWWQWPRTWLVGAAVAIVAIGGVAVLAQHRTPAPALTGQRRAATVPTSSLPPVVTASPTPTPSAAAASGLQLERTATATWSDDQGYDYEATVTLGHLVAYQAGLLLDYPGAGGKLVAGTACQLTPGRDAVIPGQVTAYNETRASLYAPGSHKAEMVVPAFHNPNLTPLVQGPTIRLAQRHAKVRRDGYRGTTDGAGLA